MHKYSHTCKFKRSFLLNLHKYLMHIKKLALIYVHEHNYVGTYIILLLLIFTDNFSVLASTADLVSYYTISILLARCAKSSKETVRPTAYT